MWLMTKHGFYSVVEKTPGEYQVRARERRDLDNLIDVMNAYAESMGYDNLYKKTDIQVDAGTDYEYRIVLDGNDRDLVFAALSESIDYPNFKNEIARRPDQKNKPYHDIWLRMVNALSPVVPRRHESINPHVKYTQLRPRNRQGDK